MSVKGRTMTRCDCGSMFLPVGGAEQCRPCRGWHVCTICDERKDNDEFHYQTAGKWNSRCKKCQRHIQRKYNRRVGLSNQKYVIPEPKYEDRETAFKAYGITPKLRRWFNWCEPFYRHQMHRMLGNLPGPGRGAGLAKNRFDSPDAVLRLLGATDDEWFRVCWALVEVARSERWDKHRPITAEEISAMAEHLTEAA